MAPLQFSKHSPIDYLVCPSHQHFEGAREGGFAVNLLV